jgi:uncharacterized protein (DUF1684 family)
MQTNWAEQLRKWRGGKDDFFSKSAESPIPPAERTSFRGLRYFPPDVGYAIRTRLRRHENVQTIMMSTSKGTTQRHLRFGYFQFGLNGEQVTLQGYKASIENDTHLFIPFRDRTSGRETYGAARYVDLEITPDDTYLLDFNYAYNPYCAYSDNYICPLPPAENWLKVEVRAGELKYH